MLTRKWLLGAGGDRGYCGADRQNDIFAACTHGGFMSWPMQCWTKCFLLRCFLVGGHQKLEMVNASMHSSLFRQQNMAAPLKHLPFGPAQLHIF